MPGEQQPGGSAATLIRVEVQRADVLDAEASAILLTIDGAGPGMEGNVARAFRNRFPAVWEDLKDDISYPLPLGKAIRIGINKDASCPFRSAIIVSTLHHREVLADRDKLQIAALALGHALSLCGQHQLASLAAPLLKGGWRISAVDAFDTMLRVAQRWSGQIGTPLYLSLCVREEQEFESLEERYRAHRGSRDSAAAALEVFFR